MAAEVYLILLLVHLLVALLVYQDARSNSPHSAVLWGLVVLFAGFVLGTLLYVLLGRDRSTSSVRRRSSSRSESSDEPMNVDDSGPF